MKLMTEILKKLVTAVDIVALDPGKIPPWDMTNEREVDIWIDIVGTVLLRLLELRGKSEGGVEFLARRHEGGSGLVCRARELGRSIKIVLVSEDHETGAKESISLDTYHPNDKDEELLVWNSSGRPQT